MYSLGVVLYQMLTGRFPYEVKGTTREVLDRIQRQDPLRPSTIRRKINNEIETIVLKCLAKERDRRYQSAGELARDIGHYLNGEPIEAKRDSAWYIIGKTLRRHRAPTTFAATVLILIIGFGAAMSFAYENARREAKRAKTVATFLGDMLAAADPEYAQRNEDVAGLPLYGALLDSVQRAAREIDVLSGVPEDEERVRNAIGHIYLNLGQFEAACAHLERALELAHKTYLPGDPRIVDNLNLLAWARKELRAFPAAEEAYKEALELGTAAARRDSHSDKSVAIADSLNGLGQLYFVQRRYDEAEECHRKALAMREALQETGARDSAGSHAKPGSVRHDMAPLAEPEKLLRDVASSRANLGSVLRETDQLPEAEKLLRDALDKRQQLFGDAHFHTVVSMNKLGLLLRQKGELDEARRELENALQQRRAVLGKHPHVAVSLHNLGLVLCDESRYDEAISRMQEAVELWTDLFGPRHEDVGRGLTGLAMAYRGRGDLKTALSRCQQALDTLPENNAYRPDALTVQSQLLLDTGDAVAANAAAYSAYDTLQKQSRYTNRTALAAGALGNSLVALGKYSEAEPLLLESYTYITRVWGPQRPERREALGRLIRLYKATEQPEQVENYQQLLAAATPG